jgi:hypothetical protein
MSRNRLLPRWTPATGDHSDRQLHAIEFIAESLDRIDAHLERNRHITRGQRSP